MTFIKEQWLKFRKERLRKKMKHLRRNIGHEVRTAKSQIIANIIEELPLFQNAQTVLLYYPIGREVDSSMLLHKWHNKKVMLLPSVVDHHMELHQYVGHEAMKKGKFGIPEPTTDVWKGEKIDLILVPGVAFDRQKYRMGRGGGYYDRFLSKHMDVPTIGLAYDFQIVDKLPIQHHDQRMQYIVTEKQIILHA